MANYDVFAEVDPKVLSTLGNLVQPVTYCYRDSNNYSSVHFSTIYRVEDKFIKAILKKIYTSTDDIVAKDKVFFTPKQECSAYKLKDITNKINAKVTKSYDNATVIMIPNSVLGYDVNGEATCRSGFTFLKKQLLLKQDDEHTINYQYIKNLPVEITAKGHEYIYFDNDSRMKLCRRIINDDDLNSELPTHRAYDLDDYLFPKIENSTAKYFYVSGYFLNLILHIKQNKVKIISEDNFFDKYSTPSMILNKDVVNTIKQMCRSSNKADVLVGLSLLSNSDYKNKLYYTWKLANDHHVYSQVYTHRNLKDVRHFLDNSDFQKLDDMRPFSFWMHLFDNSSEALDYFKNDEVAMKEVKESMQKQFHDSLPHGLQRAMKEKLASCNFTIELTPLKGVE